MQEPKFAHLLKPASASPGIKKTLEEEVPFYVQLGRFFHSLNTVRFIENPNGEITILLLSAGKWNVISKRELAKYCKRFLRKFLNQKAYSALERAGTPQLEIVEMGMKITIDGDILENARKNHFTLTKERQLLIEELYDMPEMYQPEDTFLSPVHILPFKNGFLDLRDGTFCEYGEKGCNGFLYQLDANYRREYEHEPLPKEFENLLRNGLSRHTYPAWQNEGRYDVFLDAVAYSFWPANPFRKLFLIIGPTACGKSTFVSIMRSVFGDMGLHLQSYAMMRQSRYDHELRPDLKAAMDRLWLDISETDEKQEIDAVTVKSFTGNDPLTFRKPHSEDRITKVMKCKIWIITNTFPKIINYNDQALQDRMVIFDWHNSIAPECRNDDLVTILTSPENRDRIATYFANRAVGLYRQPALKAHRSFEYNVLKYFLGQGDMAARFYDQLPKLDHECAPNPLTCVSVWDLAGLYYQFLAGINGHDVPFSDSDRRAFDNRFSEIAKSDRFYAVKAWKDSAGRHFYTGITIPPENRPWPFTPPMNSRTIPIQPQQRQLVQ